MYEEDLYARHQQQYEEKNQSHGQHLSQHEKLEESRFRLSSWSSDGGGIEDDEFAQFEGPLSSNKTPKALQKNILDQNDMNHSRSSFARTITNKMSGDVELLNVVSPDESMSAHDPHYFETSFDGFDQQQYPQSQRHEDWDHGDPPLYTDSFDNAPSKNHPVNRIDEEDSHDEEAEQNRMFEPYHDQRTNRIIMRMRMGNLMDDENDYRYEDSTNDVDEVQTEVVEEQSRVWPIFNNPGFDKFSLFHKSKSKDEKDDDSSSPFHQVAFTDPYNAWDSLPTFLQSPYNFISAAKNGTLPRRSRNGISTRKDRKKGETWVSQKKKNHRQEDARHKMKQKMKETRINKQGFLEESTISTSASSYTASLPSEAAGAPSTPMVSSSVASDSSLRSEKTSGSHQQQRKEASGVSPSMKPQYLLLETKRMEKVSGAEVQAQDPVQVSIDDGSKSPRNERLLEPFSVDPLSVENPGEPSLLTSPEGVPLVDIPSECPNTNQPEISKQLPSPRRLSAEGLASPFPMGASPATVIRSPEQSNEGTQIVATPIQLQKSHLESPFANKVDKVVVDTPNSMQPIMLKHREKKEENTSREKKEENTNAVKESLIEEVNASEKKRSPGRLNPGRLKSPFLNFESLEADDSSNDTSLGGNLLPSPRRHLSQSQLQSPFLQQDQQANYAMVVEPENSSPARSPLPTTPDRPTAAMNKSSSPNSRQVKKARNVSLSPLSAPILKNNTIDKEPKPSIDSILVIYRSMIENKTVTTTEELEEIMNQEGHLSSQAIQCFLFALGLNMPSHENRATRSKFGNLASDKRVKMGSPLKSTSSDAGTTTSGNSSLSQRLKARASSKSTPFDANVSNLMAMIKKENAIPKRQVRAADDAKTSISVMSSLSCRELSIQRLRRRLAASRKNEKHEVDKLLQELQDAQTRQKRLETQLNKAGIAIAEDIPYAEAKLRVSKIAEKMQGIGTSQATHPDPKIQAKLRQDYFVLEQEMEKYMRALELTDEYLEEQERLEKAFDNDNLEENQKALQQVWRHMPVNIRQQSVEDWLATRSPSGKFIPKPFLLKFARTNILTLLRMQPDFVQRAHPSNLEQRRVTGLTITERRALQAYLSPIASRWRHAKDPMTKRKWNWYCILRQTLKDHLLTHQCHVNKPGQLDYSKDDYGYPCNLKFPEYEKPCDPASSPQKKPASGTASKGKPAPSSRNSLLAEISAPKKGKRHSLMDEISSPQNKKKMIPRKSSLMEEIAAKAALRKAKDSS